MKHWRMTLSLLLVMATPPAFAELTQRVVDIPTRPGVTQRFLLLSPAQPKAAVILLAGGHGGLQITASGGFGWGAGNFLVRSRELFASQDLAVAVLDAPSDRQRPPYLAGFRQTAEHAADVKAVIAWLRAGSKVPVWLVGTSRGTQSAAYVATALDRQDGPDGLVLTATILTDAKGIAVPRLPLEKLAIPVLVVHHEQDGCDKCRYSDMPALMQKLDGLAHKQLVSLRGGRNEGDPCEARAYHGFNGVEREVVEQIAAWIAARGTRVAQAAPDTAAPIPD
jgi:hypothetical protein